MQKRIGFIGFGEAAYHIAKGLKNEGLETICAYDKMWDVAPYADLVQGRAKECGVTLLPNLQSLVEGADIVISSVSANVAVLLAQESAPYLRKGQLYVDLNSAGPDTKTAANAIVSPKATFVDVAVMGTVPGNGHKVPMLAAGDGAVQFAEGMNPFGMNITVLEGPAGKASASKMFRSIFMKGFVTLLIECVMAGRTYGIEDDVLASITETLTAGPLPEIVNGMISRCVIHAERREHEMDEVIATLKSLNIDSTMSVATKEKLHWCVEQGFKAYFKGVPPQDFHEIFAAMPSK